MASTRPRAARGARMSRLWPLLLPDLRRFPAAQRRQALQAAADTALDPFELLGMAAALVCVTGLSHYALADLSPSIRWLAALFDFALALPLLALALAPFHLRRLRRGLHEQQHQGSR